MGSSGQNARVAGKWFITPHAVRQYRERVRECSYEEALADLIRLSEAAHFVRQAQGACEMWRGPRKRVNGKRTGGVRLFVGPGSGDLPALVTVLGEHDDATGIKM
jgi:hypothetical protein